MAYVAACVPPQDHFNFWVLMPPEQAMVLGRQIGTEQKVEADMARLRLEIVKLEGQVSEADARGKAWEAAKLSKQMSDNNKELTRLAQIDTHVTAKPPQMMIDGIDISSAPTFHECDKKAIVADIISRTTVAAANLLVAGQLLHGLARAGLITAEIAAAIKVGGGATKVRGMNSAIHGDLGP